MLIVVNLTLGFWLLEFISVFCDVAVAVTGCSSKRYTRSVCFASSRKRDVQVRDTSLTRVGSSRKLAKNVLIISFDSGLNFSGWWW